MKDNKNERKAAQIELLKAGIRWCREYQARCVANSTPVHPESVVWRRYLEKLVIRANDISSIYDPVDIIILEKILKRIKGIG